MIAEFESTTLGYLIMWIFIIILVTIIYGMVVLKSFIQEVN
jgi:cytochrome oxidase assembly protein ShyY1